MKRNIVNIEKSPIEHYVRDWIIHLKATGLAPKSVQIYQYYIHCFAYWWREYRPDTTEPEKFTNRDCTAFMAYLAEPNPARWGMGHVSKAKETLSDSSRKLIITIVKAFFGWLEEEKIIRDNPWLRTKVKIKIDTTRPVRALTTEEIRTIFDWLENPKIKRRAYNQTRDLALIALMLDTGLRRQEVANLILADLRVEAGRVYVRKGKGGKDREVPFGGSTRKLITDYLDKYRLRQSKEPSGSLWLAQDGAPLVADSIKGILDRIRTATGIKHLHPHALRHTCATKLVERLGIYDVCRILGHASVSETERYSKHNPDSVAAAYAGNSPMAIMGIVPTGKRRPGRPRKYED